MRLLFRILLKPGYKERGLSKKNLRKGDVDDKELANTVSHAEDARESVISKSFQRASISLSPANRSHAVVSRTFQSLDTFRDFRNLSTGHRSGQSEILPEIQFRSDDSYGSRAIATPWCRLSSLCRHSTIGGGGTVVETPKREYGVPRYVM